MSKFGDEPPLLIVHAPPAKPATPPLSRKERDILRRLKRVTSGSRADGFSRIIVVIALLVVAAISIGIYRLKPTTQKQGTQAAARQTSAPIDTAGPKPSVVATLENRAKVLQSKADADQASSAQLIQDAGQLVVRNKELDAKIVENASAGAKSRAELLENLRQLKLTAATMEATEKKQQTILATYQEWNSKVNATIKNLQAPMVADASTTITPLPAEALPKPTPTVALNSSPAKAPRRVNTQRHVSNKTSPRYAAVTVLTAENRPGPTMVPVTVLQFKR